jgi:hypothetical protein
VIEKIILDILWKGGKKERKREKGCPWGWEKMEISICLKFKNQAVWGVGTVHPFCHSACAIDAVRTTQFQDSVDSEGGCLYSN